MSVVLDASVFLKTLVDEEGSDRAEILLADVTSVHAPSLLVLETAATLAKKVRRGELTDQLAKEGMDLVFHHLGGGFIVVHPDNDFVSDAVRIAFMLRHPLYDCLYLAVAVALRMRLVTADDRFVRKVATSGFAGSIALL